MVHDTRIACIKKSISEAQRIKFKEIIVNLLKDLVLCLFYFLFGVPFRTYFDNLFQFQDFALIKFDRYPETSDCQQLVIIL